MFTDEDFIKIIEKEVKKAYKAGVKNEQCRKFNSKYGITFNSVSANRYFNEKVLPVISKHLKNKTTWKQSI